MYFRYLAQFGRPDLPLTDFVAAEAALKQIDDMHYADPYAADPRRLFKIGVNFDSKTRRMSEWKVAQ